MSKRDRRGSSQRRKDRRSTEKATGVDFIKAWLNGPAIAEAVRKCMAVTL